MFPPKSKMCHLTGFKQQCLELTGSGACADRWARFTGKNQDGKDEDYYGCVDDYAHRLDLDRGRRLTAIQAAVEKRADMVAAHVDHVAEAMLQLSAQLQKQHVQAMALMQHQHDEAVAISTGCRPMSLGADGTRRLLSAPPGERDEGEVN